MYLKSIEIQNIRGLAQGKPLRLELAPRDGSLAGWTVVAGPNGSGKSTLLRAIALACAGVNVMEFLHPSRAWWLSKGALKGRVTVSLQKGPNDAWVTPDLEFHGVGEDGTVDLGVELRRSSSNVVISPAPEEQSVRRAEFGPWISQDKTPGWFIAGYGPFRRLVRGSRDSDRLLDSPKRPVAQLAALFLEDVALREPLEWLQRLELANRDGKPQALALKPKVLNLISDGLLPGSAKIVGVDSDGLQIRDRGRTLALSQLSDGYQTVVGLVLDLVRQLDGSYEGLKVEKGGRKVRVLNEGIVLIDEVEAHLHPRWQKRIGGWFVEHFPKMQFIVSTHSPFICQEAQTGCIIRLAGPMEETKSRVLTRKELDIVLRGTADDVYLSGAFNVDTTRGTIGVRALNRMTELESRLLDDLATDDETREYEELKRLATASAQVLAQLQALQGS